MALQAENSRLRQELSRAHEELANVESQLEHVMSVIKRALLGDALAGEYLANITGVSALQYTNEHPPEHNNQTNAIHQFSGQNENSQLKERLNFLNNALDEHLDEMENNSKQRRTSAASSSRSNSSLRRTNSASSLEFRKKSKDFCVGDLILEKEKKQSPVMQVRFSPNETTPLQSLQNKKTYEPVKHPYLRMTENNGELPNGHLFNPSDVVPQKRPSISSADLRKADMVRSKPRSGSIKSNKDDSCDRPTSSALMSGRPMKYEIINPQFCVNAAAAKPPPGRAGSAPQAAFGRTTRASILAPIPPGKNNGSSQDPNSDNQSSQPNAQNPEKKKTRLYPARPSCIDEFSNEMTSLHNLEAEFEKTAINLQKKLGIESDGIVLP